MSNDVTIRGTFGYPSPGGVNTLDSLAIVAPYESQELGTITVPSGATPSTAYDVSFNDITKATSFFTQNNTSNDLEVALGTFRLPPGGYIVVASPTAAGASGLSSCSLTLRSTAATAGTIAFRVMGNV